uniref:CID domain-containing protein n=1 Tax=Kalanchoe fedtschenkoi TaxID=63787 RepID=A0A7N0VAU4_KALFE
MGSTFNPQILLEKLTKLNSSQQSIETLSHWCIFHMNKAKLVVETWDRQFHRTPHEQRLAFLYLANDILQNSRRKGSEFVSEFWKVLPNALRYVIEHGDEFSRNGAIRLVNIWDDRKVFGSRGQILKEGISGRMPENANSKHSNFKLRQPAANTFEKIASDYQALYGGDLDEDVILNKCRNSISSVKKIDMQVGADIESGNLNGSGLVEELQGQHGVLKDCVEKLVAIESSRENLVTHLREALQEQEYRLDHIRNELQAAQSHSDQAANLFHQLQNVTHVQLATGINGEANNTAALTYVPQNLEQSAPVMYSRQMSSTVSTALAVDDPRKSAAAAVAAKLTASTSSVQMLSYVLSSLASEGVIGHPVKDPTSEYPPGKKPKLDNSDQAYIPQPPLPLQKPFVHPDSFHKNVLTSTSQQVTSNELPSTLASSAPQPLEQHHPPLPPFLMPQYIQNGGSINNSPYSYGPPPPGYSTVGAPVTGNSPFGAPMDTNVYHTLQGSDGNFYTQTASLSLPPMAPQP